MKVDNPVGIISTGIKSAGLRVVCSCDVPFLAFQFEPVILQTSPVLSSPKMSIIKYTGVSTRFTYILAGSPYCIFNFLTLWDFAVAVDLDYAPSGQVRTDS